MLGRFHRAGWLQHNVVLFCIFKLDVLHAQIFNPYLFFVLCDLFIGHLNSSCQKDKHVGLLCVSYKEEKQFLLII